MGREAMRLLLSSEDVPSRTLIACLCSDAARSGSWNAAPTEPRSRISGALPTRRRARRLGSHSARPTDPRAGRQCRPQNVRSSTVGPDR